MTRKNLPLLLIALLYLGISNINAQGKKAYKVISVGFYNFENLFDTVDTEGVRDTEFTPKGERKYTSTVYNEKIEHLSRVVSQMATELTPDGLALLGVSEIENESVLQDFVKHPNVQSRDYKIVHRNSADKRGIDVALIYNPKLFEVLEVNAIRPMGMTYKDGDTVFTRDILHVKGKLDGDVVDVFVNHWPSRRGGSYLREWVAGYVKKAIKKITQKRPNAKIIVMGDLNDDPTNKSVKKVLNAKGKRGDVKYNSMYNPWMEKYKKGIGTLAYRDSWNLFDQIIISYGLTKRNSGYSFYKAEIFKKPYLISKSGRFKGYPFRTYSFGKYVGGYSDHLPVYMYFVKEK